MALVGGVAATDFCAPPASWRIDTTRQLLIQTAKIMSLPISFAVVPVVKQTAWALFISIFI
jgi:hypothetical protein